MAGRGIRCDHCSEHVNEHRKINIEEEKLQLCFECGVKYCKKRGR